MATSSQAFNIKKVDHTGITVTSIRDALEFWVGIIGFKHLYTTVYPNDRFIENVVGVPGACLTVAMIEGPGHCIELLEYSAPEGRQILRPRSCDVGSVHIAFIVDDLDRLLDRIRAAGWNTVGVPQTVQEGDRRGLKLTYVRDHDGVTLEFLQPSETARNSIGSA